MPGVVILLPMGSQGPRLHKTTQTIERSQATRPNQESADRMPWIALEDIEVLSSREERSVEETYFNYHNNRRHNYKTYYRIV